MQPRQRSFKALSKAQPIKKQIDETLMKLQQEKRHFLAFEREEAQMKATLQQKRKQLNELKKQEFETKTHLSKTVQNINVCHHVDRNHEVSIDSLNQLKTEIQVKRKQIFNYKRLNDKLNEDVAELEKKINHMVKTINNAEKKNQNLKDQLIEYRLLHHKNVNEFQQSHLTITREDFKAQNERKKSALLQKSFLNEELRTSRALPYQNLSEMLKDSGIHHNEGNVDLMTDSVPLIKHRVQRIIHFNKDKLKVCDNYRKFGDGLDEMFKVMKKYKGREDLAFISTEFIAKQTQIQKLEEYVSTLQGSITMQEKKLEIRKKQDKVISGELQRQRESTEDKHYEKLNNQIKKEIEQLKAEEKEQMEWLSKVGKILSPLRDSSTQLSELQFNQNNALLIISQIQQKMQKKKKVLQNNMSPSKFQINPPSIDTNDVKGFHNQLLSYEKMKDFAEEFVKTKNNP